MTSRRKIAVVLLLVLATLMPPAAGGDEDEDVLLDAATARLMAKTARDLAGVGRARESAVLLDALARLGHPSAACKRLRGECARAGTRPRPSASRLKAARRQVDKIADLLCERLDSVSADCWEILASQILRIDATRESAHEMLDHENTDEGWLSKEKATTREGRERVQGILLRARRRDFPIEKGESDHLLLRDVCGQDCGSVRFENVEIHGPLTHERLGRILREALRARSISQEIIVGSPDLKPLVRPKRFLLVDSVEGYLRAADAALRDGGIDRKTHVATRGDLRSFYCDKPNRTMVIRFQAEMPALATIVFQISDWRYTNRKRTKRVQPCLLAGHVNWLCLSYLGVPMPGLRWEETVEKRVAGAGTGADAGDEVVRERLMKSARAGILGCRSWMAHLARLREDPPWSSAMLGREGEIRGNPLLKATMVAAYLQERGDFAKILAETAQPNRGGGPVHADAALFEDALAEPLSSFEESWRRWIVPPEPSVLARLDGAGPDAPGKGERLALADLERIRRAAFADRGMDDHEPLFINAELSAGALAHARYLSKHTEQLAAWPDAHEEWPDREGFSVAGSTAGLRSVIAPNARSPQDAIASWMGTFYHRLPLLAYGLKGIGWGHESGIAVLDTGSLVESWTSATRFVVWPPDGMKDVPRRFEPELPHPVPGENQSRWGYPVTIQGGLYDRRFTMKLYDGKAEPANEVPCHLSTPWKPTNPELAPGEAACLIPKAHLKPTTTYRVVVEHLPEGASLTWTFRTGR